MTKFFRILIPVLILSFLVSCEDKTPCNCDDQPENGTCNDEEQVAKVDETVADETNVDETVDKDTVVVEKVDEDTVVAEPVDEDMEKPEEKQGDYVIDEQGGNKNTPPPVEGSGGLLDMATGAALDWVIKSGLIMEKADAFTISYSEGYNINFEITQDQARELLPDNIRPVKLKILENEEAPRYYISLYLAGMESSDAMERCDVFTYGIDHNDELTMFFLAGIMQLPDMVKSEGIQKDMFEKVLVYMARDSRTGEAAYPHYYSENISSDADTLIVTYEDAKVELQKCDPATVDNRFSRPFVLVNSQIYRTDIDRNVNYFNQSFINAKVQEKDLNCLKVENPEKFHPMLKKENLRSVQYYGAKNKQVRWYFEM
jgi:hypothetical protein